MEIRLKLHAILTVAPETKKEKKKKVSCLVVLIPVS